MRQHHLIGRRMRKEFATCDVDLVALLTVGEEAAEDFDVVFIAEDDDARFNGQAARS